MIAALGVCLVVLGAWASVTDVRRRVIPNLCCVLVATCGLVLQVARAFWEVFAGSVPPPALCLVTAAGVAVLGGSAELIARRVAGRAFVGLGDVKYVAAWVCVLGPLSSMASWSPVLRAPRVRLHGAGGPFPWRPGLRWRSSWWARLR